MKDLSTGTLLQWYANANKTCSCGGHHKGNMNESLRTKYVEELKTRNVIVPNGPFDNTKPNVEIPVGIFNGEGSY